MSPRGESQVINANNLGTGARDAGPESGSYWAHDCRPWLISPSVAEFEKLFRRIQIPAGANVLLGASLETVSTRIERFCVSTCSEGGNSNSGKGDGMGGPGSGGRRTGAGRPRKSIEQRRVDWWSRRAVTWKRFEAEWRGLGDLAAAGRCAAIAARCRARQGEHDGV